MQESPFNPFPVLETERLLLREMKKEDLQDVYSYASNPELTTFLMWEHHKTIKDSEAFIDLLINQYQKGTGGAWAIVWKENNSVIGTMDLGWKPKQYSAELAYALSLDYWRKGIGTEAAKAVLCFGFETLKLERIDARCHPDNIASYKLMEKLGMTYEGTLRKSMQRKGKQEDAKIYSILKDEFKQ
ncbi:GNAT family N-acetyltransferase [Oceanobacillus jeddahense]|uniref:GNAT family N-acetyltransferase n=1 Tax=Oceanobacillus jeddahense TaxID=1462527 RepID=A0ABY5JS15_9BACI|nr:GNAT family protein [Oceanobacillus jeddahense]UUI02232.1 GNAT family N-acetyltransferase [Oceanobacillus jeddahense]